MRLPLAEAPAPDRLLPHRLVIPEEDATVALFVFDESGFGIEILAGASVLEPGPMPTIVVFGVDVVGKVASRQPRGLGARGEARQRDVLSDAEARVGTPRPIPVPGPREASGCRAVDEHGTDARPVRQLPADSQHREVVAGRRARVAGLHVQD